MIRRKLFFFILTLVLLIVPFRVGLSNSYMGGYFNYNLRFTTTKTLVSINYQNTQPSQIPSGNNYLTGVLSVAGADDNSTPTGWILQNCVGLFNDGEVDWAPQEWYQGQEVDYRQIPVGYYNYPAFYVRIDTTATKLQYKIYTYTSAFDIEHDNPRYNIWETNLPNNTKKLLVGTQTHNGIMFKHLQFGVESPSTITTSWELLNSKPCYFNSVGGWSYLACNATYGPTSYITWIGSYPYVVGGQTYTGVNTSYSYNDTVCWKHTGSTISDNAQLWSGSGSVSDQVSRPYEP
jgi:hypothetical protein